MRPLAPRSKETYARALRTAFGREEPPFDVPVKKTLGEPTQHILRCAIRRTYKEHGLSEAESDRICGLFPAGYTIQRKVRIPSEHDATSYEAAAAALPPVQKALAIIPLALGLRASEVCNLTRDEVKAAIKTGELVFTRKGGAEHILAVRDSLKPYFEALLAARTSPPRSIKAQRLAHLAAHDGRSLPRPMAWTRVGELLSPTPGKDGREEYRKLLKLVKKTAKSAGLEGVTPHKLRHAFATRMARDGANLFTIQYALNHKNLATTQLYVHPSAADAARHMRDF